MGFQLQSSAEFLYGLTFTIIFGLSFAAVWALYRLGDLPGRIARSRRHPKAAAIGVCGWLGLLVFFLWPIALAWAYKTPKAQQHRTLTEEDLAALAAGLRETSEQIAAVESRLRVHSSKKAA